MDFVPENCLLGNILVVEFYRLMTLELILRISRNNHKKEPIYKCLWAFYFLPCVEFSYSVRYLLSELNYNKQFDNSLYKSTV